MTEELHSTIDKMANDIINILAPCHPSIYLYGSVTLGDFKKGWSDIDILCLTKEQITQEQADRLVELRQELLESEPDNSYYRSFEGGILTCNGFLNQSPDRVVYWGTNGQRITDKYSLDGFSMQQLLDTGILLYGDDARKLMKKPNPEDLKNDIKRHYDTIRKYTQTTGRSLYSFGWLLDIARGLYTLQTGKVIAKTVAGEWALENGLCPVPEALKKAVEIRKDPIKYKADSIVMDYAESLGPDIQRFANILEKELIN